MSYTGCEWVSATVVEKHPSHGWSTCFSGSHSTENFGGILAPPTPRLASHFPLPFLLSMFGAGRPLPSYSLLALPPLGLGAPDRHRHRSLLILPSFPVQEFLCRRAKERANALILCPGARRVLHRIPCLVASLHATLFFCFSLRLS